MSKKATLYIIQGFIAAGKSTFSNKLKKETDSIHLNPDEWVTKMYEYDYYMSHWEECFDNTLNHLWKLTKEYLTGNKNVIFDMGFWKKEDRDYARKIANECNCDCVHYYLYVPDEVLKERIITTRDSNWAKLHLDNFDLNKSKFEEPINEDVIIIHNY